MSKITLRTFLESVEEKTHLSDVKLAALPALNRLKDPTTAEIAFELTRSLRKFKMKVIVAENHDDPEILRSKSKSHQAGVEGAGTSTVDGSIVISLTDNAGEFLRNNGAHKFIDHLGTVIAHELKHREQLQKATAAERERMVTDVKRLDGDEEAQKEYLTKKHELEAWAVQIAHELLIIGGYTEGEIIKGLTNLKDFAKDSDGILMYVQSFEDHEQVLKDLVKLIKAECAKINNAAPNL